MGWASSAGQAPCRVSVRIHCPVQGEPSGCVCSTGDGPEGPTAHLSLIRVAEVDAGSRECNQQGPAHGAPDQKAAVPWPYCRRVAVCRRKSGSRDRLLLLALLHLRRQGRAPRDQSPGSPGYQQGHPGQITQCLSQPQSPICTMGTVVWESHMRFSGEIQAFLLRSTEIEHLLTAAVDILADILPCHS